VEDRSGMSSLSPNFPPKQARTHTEKILLIKGKSHLKNLTAK
jgi:hypothetical protein